MEEVKINDVSYLRSGVKSITYNPDEVEFINGIGVAKATIDFGRNEKYECYGLINEQWEEIFSDKETYAERSLMFLPYVKRITRISENDFICQIDCADDGRSWTELRHIKLIDNVAERMEVKIGSFELTDIPNILIVNNCLYDINAAKYISHNYTKLNYVGEGEFIVKDIVTSLEYELNSYKKKNEATAEYDYLYFRINAKDERTTEIFSQLMCGTYSTDLTTPYEEIKDKRTSELKEREAKLISETARLKKEVN